MKQIIVRADDLGFTREINEAIFETIQCGIIKSVGLMTNMEFSEHGVHCVNDYDICIGLHANISNGFPLTDSVLIPSLVTSNGEFKSSHVYRTSSVDFVNFYEAFMEIEAQYLKFVSLVGRKPDYFEGHAVASLNFFKALEAVATKYDCHYLPIGFDGITSFRGKKLYVYMDSMNSDYDPFATLQKCVNDTNDDGIAMLILHPGYVNDYLLNHSILTDARQKELEMIINPNTSFWLKQNQVSIISYRDIS